MIDKGIPSEKIVIGKQVSSVSSTDLGQWTSQAFDELGWYAGISYYQYTDDIDGVKLQ